VTQSLPLHGWEAKSPPGPFSAYGADGPKLDRLAAERPEWMQSLHTRLPYRAAEVVWAARSESARTLEDVLARRTRSLFLDARASIEAAPSVAAILADELRRDVRWQEAQVATFRGLAAGYLLSGR
jgi:glycerol-3-phosphate dehydrogenase